MSCLICTNYTDISNFAVPEVLFADDPSLLSNVHDQLQTMLNRLRVYAHRKSLTVNTHKSEVMCFNSRSDNCLPPLYYDGMQLSYTVTFKYFLGMVCDKEALPKYAPATPASLSVACHAFSGGFRHDAALTDYHTHT
jgi:hypothetical protein